MLSSEQLKPHTALYRIPVLIVVCLFAVCTMITTAYGLNSYHAIQRKTEQNFVGRTGLTYITGKLRQTEVTDITIPDPHTLVLVEEIDGQAYATSMYYEDGALLEAFGSHDPGTAAFRTRVTAANSFAVRFVAGDLIEIILGDSEGNLYTTVAYIPKRGAKK